MFSETDQNQTVEHLTPLAVWISPASQSGFMLYNDGTVHRCARRYGAIADSELRNRIFRMDYLISNFVFLQEHTEAPGWVNSWIESRDPGTTNFRLPRRYNVPSFTGPRLAWPRQQRRHRTLTTGVVEAMDLEEEIRSIRDRVVQDAVDSLRRLEAGRTVRAQRFSWLDQ